MEKYLIGAVVVRVGGCHEDLQLPSGSNLKESYRISRSKEREGKRRKVVITQEQEQLPVRGVQIQQSHNYDYTYNLIITNTWLLPRAYLAVKFKNSMCNYNAA